MKFLIDRLAFRDALQRVEMAIDRKPTRPVLGGVLIEAHNDSVVLMASDLDIAVRYRVQQVQVDQPGWAVIPGRELVDIVKDLVGIGTHNPVAFHLISRRNDEDEYMVLVTPSGCRR